MPKKRSKDKSLEYVKVKLLPYEARALVKTVEAAQYLANVAWNLMQDSTTKQRYGVVDRYRIHFDEAKDSAWQAIRKIKGQLEDAA